MVPAVVLIFNCWFTLNSVLEIFHNLNIILTTCTKVTKIGSIIGHRIDYMNGVGVMRGQRHIPSKN